MVQLRLKGATYRHKNCFKKALFYIRDIIIKSSFNGAGGGGRTHTVLLPRDFESRASANSTTPAYGADDRGRTGTGFNSHGILSPGRVCVKRHNI